MAPKKNKKLPKNALYYFALDFRRLRGQSISNLTESEVVVLANDEYERLSNAERHRYIEMAEKQKASGEKFTSLGVPISVQEKIEQEKKNKVNGMRNEIKTLVESLSVDLNELMTKPFYFLHINCFVRTDKGYVVPAEIAVSEFTLQFGVQRQYSEFLRVREIPSGYSCNARDIAEKTHKIPPGLACANRNAMDVYTKVNKFIHGLPVDSDLTEFGNPADPPIMYTTNREMEIVSECYGAIIAETVKSIQSQGGPVFEWQYDLIEYFNKYVLHKDAPSTSMKGPILVKIYPLEVLYNQLQLVCCQEVGAAKTPSLALAEIDIEKDKNSYAEFIACQFHEDADERPHCSRSKVVRWGYTIADYVSGPLKIKMLPLLHFPQNSLRTPNGYKTLEEAQYEQYQRRENDRLSRQPARLAGRGRGFNIPVARPPGAFSAPLPTHVKSEQFDDADDWVAVEVPRRATSRPGMSASAVLGDVHKQRNRYDALAQNDDDDDDDWKAVPVKVERTDVTPAGALHRPQAVSTFGRPGMSQNGNGGSSPGAWRGQQYSPKPAVSTNYDPYRHQREPDQGYINEARYVSPAEARRFPVTDKHIPPFSPGYNAACNYDMKQEHVKEEPVECFMPLTHVRRQQMEAQGTRTSDTYLFDTELEGERTRRYRNMTTPCPSVMSEQSMLDYARPPSRAATAMYSSVSSVLPESRGMSPMINMSQAGDSDFSAGRPSSRGVMNESLMQSYQSRMRGRGIPSTTCSSPSPSNQSSVGSGRVIIIPELTGIGRGLPVANQGRSPLVNEAITRGIKQEIFDNVDVEFDPFGSLETELSSVNSCKEHDKKEEVKPHDEGNKHQVEFEEPVPDLELLKRRLEIVKRDLNWSENQDKIKKCLVKGQEAIEKRKKNLKSYENNKIEALVAKRQKIDQKIVKELRRSEKNVDKSKHFNRISSVRKSVETEPKCEESLPKSNNSLPKCDDAVPKSDASVPKYDNSLPKSDDSLPNYDASVPKYDDSLPKSDDYVPKSDDSVPEYDDSLPKSDDLQPDVDNSLPNLDDSLPNFDEIENFFNEDLSAELEKAADKNTTTNIPVDVNQIKKEPLEEEEEMRFDIPDQFLCQVKPEAEEEHFDYHLVQFDDTELRQ